MHSLDHAGGIAEHCRFLSSDPYRPAGRHIVNPRFPGAVGAMGLSGYRLTDCIFGALAQIVPDAVRAASEGGTTRYTLASTENGAPKDSQRGAGRGVGRTCEVRRYRRGGEYRGQYGEFPDRNGRSDISCDGRGICLRAGHRRDRAGTAEVSAFAARFACYRRMAPSCRCVPGARSSVPGGPPEAARERLRQCSQSRTRQKNARCGDWKPSMFPTNCLSPCNSGRRRPRSRPLPAIPNSSRSTYATEKYQYGALAIFTASKSRPMELSTAAKTASLRERSDVTVQTRAA